MPTSAPVTPRRRSMLFAELETLPRGRHRLSREEVRASQRTRLMAAAAALLGAKGYAKTTLTEIARRAKVSPNDFYEHFPDKESCVLAAYDVFVVELIARITDSIAPAADWHQFLEGAVDAYLGALEADPVSARAFLIEMDAVGPPARRKRREGLAAIAAVLKDQHERIRRLDPSLGALPDRVYLGLVNGIRALACEALETSPERPLAGLRYDILHWVTATVRGATDATGDLARAGIAQRR